MDRLSKERLDEFVRYINELGSVQQQQTVRTEHLLTYAELRALIAAARREEVLRNGLNGARDWVAQYLELPTHRAAAESRLRLIDAALAGEVP